MQPMKVPFTANNQNRSKPINCTTINTNRNPATASPYEPRSVLENCGSPASITEQKPPSDKILSPLCDHNLQLEEEEDHVLINQNLEDWDSLMRDLGLHDDSVNTQVTQTQNPNLPLFSPVSSFDSIQFGPADFGIPHELQTYNTGPLIGFDHHVDDLIRLAECFETNSFQLGHVILARLNQHLRSPTGKPLQRAAFYFKEALQSLLTGLNPMTLPASSFEVIQTIKAHQTFSSIPPVSMFLSFTANQAILDALDGSTNVHVIDFDIGLGDHWASFMKELADKADSGKAKTVLRISALVPEEYGVESRLVGENLTQFARELNIMFDIDFVSTRTFEYQSFNSIKFMVREKIAVILSSSILRRVGSGFVNDLRRISPHVVVHVDAEGQMGFGSTSCRQIVMDGLEHYSTVLESLEAANFNGGGGDWMREIETFVLFPRIVERMEAAASSRRVTPVREMLVAAGLREVGQSEFAEIQAECLLRRAEVGGFQVIKRQSEMVLCWHDRPLVATSSWRN